MRSVTWFVLGMTSATKFSSSTWEVIIWETPHSEWWIIERTSRPWHQSKSGGNIVVTAHHRIVPILRRPEIVEHAAANFAPCPKHTAVLPSFHVGLFSLAKPKSYFSSFAMLPRALTHSLVKVMGEDDSSTETLLQVGHWLNPRVNHKISRYKSFWNHYWTKSAENFLW